jgi:hypothetical protein
MEINPTLASQALAEALTQFPQFAPYGPRLAWRPLFQGGAFLVQYETDPPNSEEGAWDFQNAVVKGYRRLAGV